MEVEDNVAALIDALTKAKNDTEKFAVLLLIPKVLKDHTRSQSENRAVFDAVGFDFLDRLLHTKNVPLGCPPYSYKSVALSVLNGFATDAELCTSSRMLVNIPAFLDILRQEDGCDLALQANAYQLLTTILAYPKGVEAITNNSALEKLCEMLTSSHFQKIQTFPLVLILLQFKLSTSPPDYPQSFQNFVTKLSFQFGQERGELKFKLCLFLNDVIVTLKGYDFTDVTWKRNVHRGLYDILGSRVTVEMRNAALALFSTMVENYGFFENEDHNAPETSDLTAIAVNLSCVELRMKLEDSDLDRVVESGECVASCYCILEHTITKLLILDSNHDRKVQLYSVIKGAAFAIIDFLSRVWKETGEQWCELGNSKLTVILASLRALAAWLAEETEACRQEVYDILPFLIAAAKQPDIFNAAIRPGHKRVKLDEEGAMKSKSATFLGAYSCESNPLRFLLPSFSHFSSETESLNIMFDHNVPELLLEEMMCQWNLLNHENNAAERHYHEIAFITIGGIFMNMIVLRGDDCRVKAVLDILQDFCLRSSLGLTEDNKGLCESTSFILLKGYIFVMGLMLLQNHFKKSTKKAPHALSLPFIETSISFLEGAHVCEEVGITNRLTVAPSYRRHWDFLMELWFLGMQCLQTLVVEVPCVGDRIWETSWLQNVLSNVTPGCLEGNQRCAFDGLLATLARHTANVASKLNNSHIKILCDVHGLQELKKVLSEPHHSTFDIFEG